MSTAVKSLTQQTLHNTSYNHNDVISVIHLSVNKPRHRGKGHRGGGERKWGQVAEGSPGQQANFDTQRWENSQPTGCKRATVGCTQASQPDRQTTGQDLEKVKLQNNGPLTAAGGNL